MSSEMQQRRLEILKAHFQSEVEHDWESCLATFGGQDGLLAFAGTSASLLALDEVHEP
jgi:hypothetical protein